MSTRDTNMVRAAIAAVEQLLGSCAWNPPKQSPRGLNDHASI